MRVGYHSAVQKEVNRAVNNIHAPQWGGDNALV